LKNVPKSNSDNGRSEAKAIEQSTQFSKATLFIHCSFSELKRPAFPQTLLPQPGPPVQSQPAWRLALFPLRRGTQTVATERQREGPGKQPRTERTPFLVSNRQLPALASNFQFRRFGLGLARTKSSLTSRQERNNGLVGAAVFHSKQLGRLEKTVKTEPD
jgi:hypothetical protein